MERLENCADERLIDGCVFCLTGLGETRDHIPSRVLLDVPLPPDLPVVPACKDCNAGFAADEEYLACLIDCTLAGSTDPADVPRVRVRTILQSQANLRARLERARATIDGLVHFTPERTRVDNVVRKLARGHAAFELGTAKRDEPATLGWCPLSSMTDAERDDFDAAHVWGMLNEIGSRATQRMMVVEAMLRSADGKELRAPLVVSDWVDVQENRYRYLAVDDGGTTTRIKMVLSEYLACEVTWEDPLSM